MPYHTILIWIISYGETVSAQSLCWFFQFFLASQRTITMINFLCFSDLSTLCTHNLIQSQWSQCHITQYDYKNHPECRGYLCTITLLFFEFFKNLSNYCIRYLIKVNEVNAISHGIHVSSIPKAEGISARSQCWFFEA